MLKRKTFLTLLILCFYCSGMDAYHIYRNCIFIDSIETSLDFSKVCPNLKELNIDYANWQTENEMRDFYAQQTTDLGLWKNKNLKKIHMDSRVLLPIFKNCSLPQVNEVFELYTEGFHYLSAFPNLQKLISYWYVDLLELPLYAPKLQFLEIYNFHFVNEYYSEYIYALSQLKDLKRITLHPWEREKIQSVELKQLLHKHLPKLEVVYIPAKGRED